MCGESLSSKHVGNVLNKEVPTDSKQVSIPNHNQAGAGQ